MQPMLMLQHKGMQPICSCLPKGGLHILELLTDKARAASTHSSQGVAYCVASHTMARDDELCNNTTSGCCNGAAAPDTALDLGMPAACKPCESHAFVFLLQQRILVHVSTLPWPTMAK
eukprot:1160891-Pelagomonas_calceolata.AAC.3